MENLKRNIYQLKNNISLFLIVIFLSSCSSMESFKFWENGEVDIDEPRKLEKFSSKYSVKNNWKISFNNAENTLGNFVPSFNFFNIFNLCLLYNENFR